MTFRSFFVVFLCCSLTFGQAASTMTPSPAAAAAAAPATTPVAAVSADTPVVTIKGVCNPPAADCSTVLTKADFEAIVQAVQPQMPIKMQRQLAAGYVQLLTTSNEARKRGLENTPRMQLRAKLSMMQALQRELFDALQEDAGKVSDSDVEKYYADHKANYEQAEMQRLVIPRKPQPADKAAEKKAGAAKAGAAKAGVAKAGAAKAGVAAKTTVAKKAKPVADEASLKALAVKLQARAAAGEDFAKLQAEAFAAGNYEGGGPETKLPKAASSTLPPAQRAVFDLKTGDVSELITDENAYFVYKMGAKTTQTLDEVKNDIRTALKNERMQQSVKAVSDQASTTLNDAYFGPPEPPTPQMGPGAPGRPMMPHPPTK